MAQQRQRVTDSGGFQRNMKASRHFCLWLMALVLQHLGTCKAFVQDNPCEDVLPEADCAYYFNEEECDRFSDLAKKYCHKTCNYCPTPSPVILSACKDILPDCAVFIKSPSQCHGAQEFFAKYCPSTCGYCACEDILDDCSSYVTNPNQCQSSLFFIKYCKKTCNICETATVSSSTIPTTSPPSTSTESPLTASSSTRLPLTESTSSSTESPLKESPSTAQPMTTESLSTKPTLTESPSASQPASIESTSTKSTLTESPSASKPASIESTSTKSPSNAPSSLPPTTHKPTTSGSTTRPGLIGCKDILSECPEIVAKDKDSCKSRDMKEYCPKSCNLCGVPCEDKMPEECSSLLASDKEYCKTRPDFMRENCARTCEYCGCEDLLPMCPSFVAKNKDFCANNPLFMKTNCPKSCNLCHMNNGNGVTPTPKNGCVDKRTKCKMYATMQNYCTYQASFMRTTCPKSCEFCEKEYNFAIQTEWNGTPINHAPVSFQISAQDSRNVLISVSAPFFDDPGPPPCAAGSACDKLWDYEVAEVFFLGKQEKYLEIELGPHGQHLLLMLNGVRKPFHDKLPIEYSATIDRATNTWTGTAKIPVDYFPPEVQKMNAYAIHGSGANRRYESLYPASADVKNPDFHRLEFFKPFDFEAMFTLSWSKPMSLYWKNIRRLLRAKSRI